MLSRYRLNLVPYWYGPATKINRDLVVYIGKGIQVTVE